LRLSANWRVGLIQARANPTIGLEPTLIREHDIMKSEKIESINSLRYAMLFPLIIELAKDRGARWSRNPVWVRRVWCVFSDRSRKNARGMGVNCDISSSDRVEDIRARARTSSDFSRYSNIMALAPRPRCGALRPVSGGRFAKSPERPPTTICNPSGSRSPRLLNPTRPADFWDRPWFPQTILPDQYGSIPPHAQHTWPNLLGEPLMSANSYLGCPSGSRPSICDWGG
jgi:hypothetical protein